MFRCLPLFEVHAPVYGWYTSVCSRSHTSTFPQVLVFHFGACGNEQASSSNCDVEETKETRQDKAKVKDRAVVFWDGTEKNQNPLMS